jgi:tight adherence protein B
VRAGLEGAIALGAVGAGALYYYLLYVRDRRIKLVGAQMPRALELMTLTLRAGHSLQRSVEVVADEMPAPTGGELRRVAEETALGRPIEEAFAAMSRRLPGVPPLRALVTGIAVLGQTGGNLIEVLERVVDFSSQQAQFQQRVRALTAENRASGLILALLPPGFAVMTTLISTDYFSKLLTEPLGRTMALAAFGFWLSGVMWIRRLIQVED